MLTPNNNSKKPFNDVMDHKQKIEGFSSRKSGRLPLPLPLPLRLIGYFFFGGILLMILFGFFANFFFN